ncbi:hypothetical protein [Bradyrhizobium sp. sGM-13]|uniref:hypothetical protein n=1 Tax=Bradyrhizobium sp. sGM-13 TaxID=2831781 RepID=UPI001BCC6395|nr:hypothetical protein [Bradyrhizobium sp. sGM-13]
MTPGFVRQLQGEQAATPHRCQIALEIITPGRHNAACSFINRNAPVYQRTLTGAWCGKSVS